ncbi:MAG: glycogen synthase GlgA [Tranquillimonas sp.]
MIRVLSVASECAPLVKTGGLADVTGALPAALAEQDVEMRVLLPGYPRVMAAVEAGDPVLVEEDLFGGPARVRPARGAGLELLVIDAPHLYDRPGAIYLGPDGRDWPDNPERFAALSWLAARIGADGAGGWFPQVLHCHDWQGGLAPLYLRQAGASGRVKSVLTIHNVAFHGFAPEDRLERLRLPRSAWHPEGLEYYGRISALKAGCVYADKLTTVSPTYARELMTPQFGMGMEGVLRQRRADLSGILNGIDTAVWDPAADPQIARPYDTPAGKVANKAALVAELGLPEGEGPLAVVISRLTEQKGLDMLLWALSRYLEGGGRLALLGTGDAGLERAWQDAAVSNPGLAVRIGYDEALSHRMMAGADAILVPSRFEPCGLTQLYGLRYGTVPVVALTGGLADTVIAANDAGLRAGAATGLQFHPVSAASLADALERLCDLYRQPDLWDGLRSRAMRHPVGWEVSAGQYAELYRGLAAA